MTFSKSAVEAILEELTLPVRLRMVIPEQQSLCLLLVRGAAEIAEGIDEIASLEAR